MWFFIDTSARGVVRLALLPRTGRIWSRTLRRLRPNAVVASASFLTPADRKALSGVCVVAGPGSFSAVRSGVLLANMLSRVSSLPLMGISVVEASDLSALRARLVEGNIRPAPYVAPVYDAEPNITC